MNNIKERIKSSLPYNIGHCIAVAFHPIRYYKRWSREQYERKNIFEQPARYKKALKELEGVECYRCVFLVESPSIFKYSYLYWLMDSHPKFQPIILVCPYAEDYAEDYVEEYAEDYAEDFFRKQNYNVIRAHQTGSDIYIDIEKDIKPHIIFYSSPYSWQVDPHYRIDNFPNILTAYVPYGFNNTNNKSICDEYVNNIVWRLYTETEFHLAFYKQSMRNLGSNCVVTGYPGIDYFLDYSKMSSISVWKDTNPAYKRIIWAPHHTIYPIGNLYYSCFLKYADFMMEMAVKYKDMVQFVFKPHPQLRWRLEKIWGKEKTARYFEKWNQMPNTVYTEADYKELFISSDAMIHDSGSFLIEYLYTKKPVMRTMSNSNPKDMYNDFALDCLAVYYKAYNEEDIEQFIVNVINDEDPLKEKREHFFKERLLPPNGKLASQNILDDIIDSIENQRV